MKPILVGEVNPYGSFPRYALYPMPSYSAGGRLRKILGMTVVNYLGMFERKNLCVGKWSLPLARGQAQDILRSRESGTIILLGAKVCKAFDVPYSPFTKTGRFLVLPHPSGRCRYWNDPGNAVRARSLVMRELLCECR